MSAPGQPTQRGQALVELAIILPFLLFFVFTCLQLAILFFANLSVTNANRDLERWLVVHPDTLDSAAATALKARLPSDLQANNITITIVPACTSLTQGHCPLRSPGNDLAVTLTYDVRSLIFLPSRFGLGGLTFQFPTILPPYTMHMEVEPH